MGATGGGDRARGLLLGLLTGDALGAPFEGDETVAAERLQAVEARADKLGYTDDSALALTLTAHLASHTGEIDQDQLALDFAATWRAEPWRGYGAGAAQVFALIVEELPWREAAQARFGKNGSCGNGGAMRVAPVALVSDELARVCALATSSAEITHAHADGIRGAVCQAVAASMALAGQPALDSGGRPADGEVEAFVRQLVEVVPGWRERLAPVTELHARRPEPTEAAGLLGNGVTAREAVPAALLAFLLHPSDVAAAVRYAIRMGGDTDTIAAMAGALTGARAGTASVPPSWLRRVEGVDRAMILADRLRGGRDTSTTPDHDT